MVSYRLVLLIDIHILRAELSMMGTYFYTIQNQKSLRRLCKRHKEHIESESGIRIFVPSELRVKKPPQQVRTPMIKSNVRWFDISVY
jgi:hypothetical protein